MGLDGGQLHDTDPEWLRAHLMAPAFQQAFNAVIMTNADFSSGGPHIIAANPAFCAMTGYDEAELIGRSPRILQGPDTAAEVIDRLSKAIREGEYFLGRAVNYRKDGTPYTVEWNISPVRDEEGTVCGFVSIQQDISPRLAAEREHALFTGVGNLLPVPLLITDATHRITFVNARLEEVTGYREAELLGRTPELLYSEDSRAAFYADDLRSLGADAEVRRLLPLRAKDGSIVHVEQRVIPVHFDQDRGVMHMGTFTDVSELVHSEARWRSLANVDALSGILNRRGGDSALAAMVRSAARRDSRLVVMMCDIDHFKRVNDSFGHAAGDRIIVAVAQTLQRALRDGDVVYRHGGEEFLVLAPDLDLAAAASLAERLRSHIAALHDVQVGSVTVSLGVAAWRPGEPAAELVDRADDALYRAKSAGRDRVVTELAV